jgi:hypothetical protein
MIEYLVRALSAFVAIGIFFGFLTRAPIIIWTGLAVLAGIALGGYFSDNRSLFIDSLSVAAGTTITGIAILVMDDARPRDKELIFNTWLVAMAVVIILPFVI